MSAAAARVAVVTGVGGGLGNSVARALLGDGWHVIGADVSLAEAPSGIRLVETDATDEDQVGRLAAAAREAGVLGAWINAAGISGRMSSFAETELSEFERVLGINLTGSFMGMRAALRVAADQRAPIAVVNFGSVASFVGASSGPAYPIAKHGVLGLTRCGAIEAGPSGSRVNAVCPGPIDAGMYRQLKDLPMPDGGTLHEGMLRAIPLGRAGQSDEVAEAVRWLVGPDAAYVNGAAFVLDGGMLAAAGGGFNTMTDSAAPSRTVGEPS